MAINTKVKRNIIEDEWQKYLKIVAPGRKDGPEIRVIKHAFLAGSISLFTTILEHLDNNKDGDVEFFNAIHDEINIILGPEEMLVVDSTGIH